jgi:oxygen-independent coproporphyrinogen III oxidase
MNWTEKVQAGSTAIHSQNSINSMVVTDKNLSGLYVHIPFCASKCAYCNFYSEPVSKHDTGRLMHALHKELKFSDTSTIGTAYIGGGSPSCLDLSQLCGLVEVILEKCDNITEFTVECNPGQINPDMLEHLHKLGVNRLSIGAQSFNDEELKCLGRIHNAAAITTAVQQAKQAGFKNISIDLIFAICGSTQTAWQYSLDTALRLNPEHISAYSLTLEHDTPLVQAIAQGKYTAVDESTDAAMYEQAIETLTKAGFNHYEISNFARPGFECLHNTGYWQNRPYIGIGPSAASSSGSKRTKNFSDIKAYINALESDKNPVEESIIISEQDKICETAVLNLRTKNGIDIKNFMLVTGQNPLVLFAEPICRHCEQGFLTIENERIFLTAKALPIADYVLCDFAAL